MNSTIDLVMGLAVHGIGPFLSVDRSVLSMRVVLSTEMYSRAGGSQGKNLGYFGHGGSALGRAKG